MLSKEIQALFPPTSSREIANVVGVLGLIERRFKSTRAERFDQPEALGFTRLPSFSYIRRRKVMVNIEVALRQQQVVMMN